MAGLFGLIMGHHQKSKARENAYDFFRAAMAASAYIAMADGVAGDLEGLRLKAFVKHLEELKMFTVRDGMELYEEFVHTLRKTPDKGRQAVADAIRDGVPDHDSAFLLATICKSMSEADGLVVAEESRAIGDVCDIVGVDPASIPKLEIETDLYAV